MTTQMRVAGTRHRVPRISGRPTIRSASAAALAHDTAIVRWARGHLTNLPWKHSDGFNEAAVPEWSGQRYAITLGGPWKARSIDKVMAGFGIPAVFIGGEFPMRELALLAHQQRGGFGVFELPGPRELYPYLVKVVKHPHACAYLELVARIAIHSQLTLSEAMAVVLDCMNADPRGTFAPRNTANDWAFVGLSVIDTWRARKNSIGGQPCIGDELQLAARFEELSRACASLQIAQHELDLTVRREAFGKRYASRPAITGTGASIAGSEPREIGGAVKC